MFVRQRVIKKCPMSAAWTPVSGMNIFTLMSIHMCTSCGINYGTVFVEKKQIKFMYGYCRWRKHVPYRAVVKHVLKRNSSVLAM